MFKIKIQFGSFQINILRFHPKPEDYGLITQVESIKYIMLQFAVWGT
jgi:hypothetical protein